MAATAASAPAPASSSAFGAPGGTSRAMLGPPGAPNAGASGLAADLAKAYEVSASSLLWPQGRWYAQQLLAL